MEENMQHVHYTMLYYFKEVKNTTEMPKKKKKSALAGVAQWMERWLANQRVAGSIPSQGTCLDWGPGPSWGHMRDNHTLMFLSLSFSLPSPLSKNK